MFDNGRIRISLLDGIPLIEVYHNGEVDLADLEWTRHIVFHELSALLKLPVDIVIDRTGHYSTSMAALIQMEAIMKDVDHVAYVVYSSIQEQTVQMLSGTYLLGRKVASFNSVSEAYAWLKQESCCSERLLGTQDFQPLPAHIA